SIAGGVQMLNKWRYPVYGVIRAVSNLYFRCVAGLKPRGTPRIFVYTDSRGFKVESWYCKKNPIGSYIAKLARVFRVDYSICEYQHTTLIDFLYDIRRVNVRQYDFIVLHV